MGGATIEESSEHTDQVEAVEIVAGDDVLGPSSAFDVIKFDIEGAEPRAALGLQSVLARSSEAAIILEVMPDRWQGQGDFGSILSRFQLSRIHTYEIAGDGLLDPLDLGDPLTLQKLAERPSGFYMLMLPRDHWAVDFARANSRTA